MVTDLLNEEELIMLSSIVLGISNMYNYQESVEGTWLLAWNDM